MEVRLITVIDGMAHRYCVLPSQVLSQADSFDYYVYDVALSYQSYQQQKEMARQGKGHLPVPNIAQEKLQDMIDRVRGQT